MGNLKQQFAELQQQLAALSEQCLAATVANEGHRLLKLQEELSEITKKLCVLSQQMSQNQSNAERQQSLLDLHPPGSIRASGITAIKRSTH